MNRSFWTAATSSGLVVNGPATKWMTQNNAETIFERLEAHGKTWKVYVCEPMPLSFTGVIHFPRLQDRLATHFVPFAEFEKDAAAGTLPDFSLIEPDMASGHNDYHPALGRSMIGNDADFGFDPPSSMLGGEAFLERVYNAYRSMTSPTGTNVWNTALLIGWDEPGGTYDHVPPGPVPPPAKAAPAGELGFTVRPVRLPGSGDHGVAVGRTGIGLQRRVPSHIPDRHACADDGGSVSRSRNGTLRPGPSTGSSPSMSPGIPRGGSTSCPNRCPTGRWTLSPRVKRSVPWARSSAPA